MTPEAPPVWLREAAAAAPPRPAAANQPLVLDDPTRCWLVESGALDVFVAARDEDGAPSGFRHVVRVPEGQLAFAAAPSGGPEGSLGLIAKGIAGTVVREAPTNDLLAAVRRHESGSELAALADVWIETIAAVVASDIVPRPHIARRVSAGPVRTEAGERIATDHGVLWIEPATDEPDEPPVMAPAFFDLEDAGPDSPAPITRDAWLTFGGEVETTACTSVELDPEALLLTGLAHFHALALGSESLNRQLGAADLFNLQNQAARHRVDAEEAARRDLSALVAGRDVAAEPDALLAALRAVGRHEGIEFHGSGSLDGEAVDAERAFAASGVHARRVRLRGAERWWRGDSGAMLAFRREDRRPVALLPARFGGYRELDPATGATRRVDAACARELDEFAWFPYAPLPERRAARSRDLVRMAARRLSGPVAQFVLVGVGVGLLTMAPPVALGILIGEVLPSGDPWTLVALSTALLPLALAAGAAAMLRGTTLMRIEGRVAARLTAALWDRLMRSAPDRERTGGDTWTRAMAFQTLRDRLGGAVAAALLAPVFLVPALAVLFLVAPAFGWLILGLGLAALLVAAWLGARQIRPQRRLLNVSRHLAGELLQFIAGVAKLRSGGAEGLAFAAWARRFRVKKESEIRISSLNEHLAALCAALPALAGVALFWLASGAESSVPGTGDFVLIYSAATVFFAAIAALGGVFETAAAFLPACEQAQPILDRTPAPGAVSSGAPLTLYGEIRFDQVRFAYSESGPEILRGVSIHARAGEFVAIIGESGAGKSTLFRLGLGLDSPVSGAVFYDDRNLEHLDHRAVRRQVGVVTQDQPLLPGSILSSILGVENLSLDDAWRAAEQAGVAEDIEAMPMQMHTPLVDRAVVSGGQMQRIRIAAALVRNPRILFLDEATSWLDATSQARTMAGIERSAATRIVIAHRLSTIRNADRIYVLEAGQVAQCGAYDELLAVEGPFRRMAARQSSRAFR